MLHHKTTKDAQTSLDRCNKIYYISFITAWKIGEKLKTAFEIEFSKCLHLISGNTIPKATFDKFEKRLVQIAKAPGEAVWTFQYGIPFHLPKFGPTLWLFRALGRNFSYIQLLQLLTLLAIKLQRLIVPLWKDSNLLNIYYSSHQYRVKQKKWPPNQFASFRPFLQGSLPLTR